jgi:hypothetical protein
MDAIPLNEVLKAPEFNSFLNTAKEYCHLIENDAQVSKNEFLLSLELLLIRLYLHGKRLPLVHLSGGNTFEFDANNISIGVTQDSIAEKIPFQYYWTVLNPLELNVGPDFGTDDLSDDLFDIHKDLKRALYMFDLNEQFARESAVWQFKFDFDNHWDEHCVSALYIINCYSKKY